MVYQRWHHDHPDSHVVVVLNFSGREQVDHPLNLPDAGNWQAAFDSYRTDYEDDHSDIGSGATKPVTVFAGGNNHRIQINLAAYSVLILTKK